MVFQIKFSPCNENEGSTLNSNKQYNESENAIDQLALPHERVRK